MDKTLLLNATYEPLKIVSWQRALHLFFQDKVDVVETYERDIRSVRTVIKAPAVIRLRKMVRLHHVTRQAKFSRSTIFMRDRHQCQYCGEEKPAGDLTLDHILPVCQGGPTTWDNIVTACQPCNYRKADRTPEQAGMALLSTVKRPHWSPAILVMLGMPTNTPETWDTYLYLR